MNIALRKSMTLPQFLAWEERQELRYEFDGFQPVAIIGGTAAHSAIQVNLLGALRARLRGKPCQPHGSELKLQVARRIRYPDAFVVCRPIAPRDTVVGDPTVVFEIPSESTSNTDLVLKNQEYRATPSIQRYVILEQTDAAAIAFIRVGEEWISEILAGADAVLPMPEIGIEVPLAELYDGVELSKPEPEEGWTRNAVTRGKRQPGAPPDSRPGRRIVEPRSARYFLRRGAGAFHRLVAVSHSAE